MPSLRVIKLYEHVTDHYNPLFIDYPTFKYVPDDFLLQIQVRKSLAGYNPRAL